MKVTIKEGLKGFSGKLEGAVYYYHPRLQRTLMRRMPVMPLQEQNKKFASIAKVIKAINPSDAYRNDFRTYLSLLREADPKVTNPSWYSLFLKLMWALQARYPAQVDLRSITLEQIVAQNLPCISIKAAVEDGLLQRVPGYQNLDHPMG